jgi:[heparan sulfate]-glucosamine 3-sulfotransferase 5
MPLAYPDQITMEKTPAYFQFAHIPELVYKMNPNIKLLLVIRNPVIRAVSSFTEYLAKYQIKYDPNNYDNSSRKFEEKVFKTSGKVNANSGHIKYGIYVYHLKPWLKYFSFDQLLIIDGEKMIIDPYSVLVKVEKFLNLNPHFKKENYVFNQEKGFFCINNEKFDKPKCESESKGRKHPFIAKEVLDKLNKFYEPFDKQLFELLKQDPFW